MADPQAEPNAGEVRIDVAALRGGDDAAAGALAGLFADDGIQPDGNETQSADTGEGETPPTGDTRDGHSEQGETPAIEPPVSWSADAKEHFAKLPPELQQVVAERESEREKLLATHGQRASEQAKAFEARLAEISNERAQQFQFFNALAMQLTPELQRFQQVNWQQLAAEKPAEWAVQSQAYQDTVNRYNAAMQAAGQIHQQNQADAAKRHQEFLTTERAKLIEKIPEFSDPLKGKAYAEELMTHIPEFSRDEWGMLADHRYFTVARDAMLYRKGQKAKADAQTKRVPSQNSNVRTLRPAARQPGSAADEAKRKELAALQGKLAKTGSERDAAALLEHIL